MLSSMLLGVITACQPQEQTVQSARNNSCAGASCNASQSSSDLKVELKLAPYTNARDIPIAWVPVEGVSEYQLEIASDEACTQIQQSKRLKNNDTLISDLGEGTYYVCLKWKFEAKISQGNGNGVKLVVDRKAPEIKASEIQNLKSGESPVVDATDELAVRCSWSTDSSELKIIETAGASRFETMQSGSYQTVVSCQDEASNSTDMDITINITSPPIAIVTTPPAAVINLAVNAGPDLLRNQMTSLTASATDAVSYLWAKVSGPGTITLSSPSSLATNVSASADGIYVLRLTVTASDGSTAQDEMTLSWDTTAPSVNAGQDVVIGTATALQGSFGADAVTTSWRKVSGTGTISFSSLTSPTPTVSASADGTYILELSATDAAGNTASDQMQFQWNTTIPTVNVGADLTIRALTSLAPSSSGATIYAWSKVSGPGTVTFSAASAKNTNISASADGSYVIRLTVSNTQGQTANDTLTMVWDTVPPTVNAGLDSTQNLSFTQTGTATGAASYSWSKVSGPGTIAFGTATALATTISASLDGSYTLRLTATDAASNAASDDMVLTWDTTAPGNVTGLVATPGIKSMSLAWADGGNGTVGYMILRSTASITSAPARGSVYTIGTALGAATVVGVGAATSLSESGLTANTTYFYKVFAYDALRNYTSGVEASAMANPLRVIKPTLSRTGFLGGTKVMGLRNLGSYTYVCKQELGLGIVNTSNPASPTQTGLTTLGNTNALGWCSDVKVSGTMAYVADWDKGLVIADVSNPASPVTKGSLALTNASIVWVEGNYAYVAVEDDTTGGGLAIVNVTNPMSPTLTSYTETVGNAAGVVKIGNYVYLTHRDSGTFTGLKVLNVSNPASPTVVQSLVRDSMEEIVVSGNYAYVAAGYDGIEIFDVSAPANPVSKSVKPMPDTPSPGYCLSVSVAESYAFAVDFDARKVHVFDVTNKTSPTLAKSYTVASNGDPLYIHVSGNNAFLTVDTKGLEIIEVFQEQ